MPRARASIFIGGLAALVGVLVFFAVWARPRPSLATPAGPSLARTELPLRPDEPAPQAEVVPAVTKQESTQPGERADAHLVRWYRAPLAGGLLMFPPSFSSADGQYDIVLHLNGNTDLVEESFGFAHLNAAIVILNLGVGSGVYEDRFADPAAFRLILSRAQEVMEARGLENARLRRIGLSGWSSGYGGIIKILQHGEFFDRIDAIILFDSIHCGYDPYSKQVKRDQFEPTLRFAKKAVEGRALLTITHSEIVTYGYHNARKTTDMLLEAVGVPRLATSEEQPMPELRSMWGVVPNKYMRPLPPLSEAHGGELHVRGYAGNGPITHMLHLVQMSTTALPDLVRYWGKNAKAPAGASESAGARRTL
jgi:hypothetical protein